MDLMNWDLFLFQGISERVAVKGLAYLNKKEILVCKKIQLKGR